MHFKYPNDALNWPIKQSMECWMLYALSSRRFNYVVDGAGLSDSNVEWQNNLIQFIHYTAEHTVHKYKVYKCIVCHLECNWSSRTQKPNFLSYRKLCPLSEGGLVVQRLRPLQPERRVVPRWPLPQPLPGWSLLGRVPWWIVFLEEGHYDDQTESKYFPLEHHVKENARLMRHNKKKML